MATPVDVARYLIKLAGSGTEPDCLTQMQLHKLLYYAQGWALATFGRPLFEGRIEAWIHGPVVKQIYSLFRDFGDAAIPASEGADAVSLIPADRALIVSVWEEYKPYSASGLREMTHREAPWLEARQGLPDSVSSAAEITADSLASFFRQRLRDALARGEPRLDLALWERSREAVQGGRVQAPEEIRCALRSAGPGAGQG